MRLKCTIGGMHQQDMEKSSNFAAELLVTNNKMKKNVVILQKN